MFGRIRGVPFNHPPGPKLPEKTRKVARYTKFGIKIGPRPGIRSPALIIVGGKLKGVNEALDGVEAFIAEQLLQRLRAAAGRGPRNQAKVKRSDVYGVTRIRRGSPKLMNGSRA
jgi:hypothetical protein